MGINLNFLSAVAGAATGYQQKMAGLKEKYEEKELKQTEWMQTYGQKAVQETKQQSEIALSTARRLKEQGFDSTKELIEKHGISGLMQFGKQVEEHETSNNVTLDAATLNRIYSGTEDYQGESENFETAINNVFYGPALQKQVDTDAEEKENMTMLEKISKNLSGDRYKEEYDEFLEGDTFFDGRSISDVRRMQAGISLTGKEGDVVLDRSVLAEGTITSAQTSQWNMVEQGVLSQAIAQLSEDDKDAIQFYQSKNSFGEETTKGAPNAMQITRLRNNHPELYKTLLLDVGAPYKISENPAAIASLGTNYFDPVAEPSVPTVTAEQLATQAAGFNLSPEDVAGLPTIEVTGSNEDKRQQTDTWFKANPTENYALIDGNIIQYEPEQLPPEDPSQADVRFIRGEDESTEDYLARIKGELTPLEGTGDFGNEFRKMTLDGVDQIFGVVAGTARATTAAFPAAATLIGGFLGLANTDVIKALEGYSESELSAAYDMIVNGTGLFEG